MPNLIVIKPSSFGDIVHGLLVAQSIREQRPEARLTWVAREVFAPLVECCTAVDEVLIYERHGGWSGLRRLRREIAAGGFDWALDMQGLARSGLMTQAAKGATKVGRSDAREMAGLFYGQTVALPEQSRHAVDILREFLPVLGLEKELRGQLHFDTPEPSAYGKELLARRPVVLFPDSRRPEKEWGGFEALTSLLLARCPELTVVWAGTSEHRSPSNWPQDRFVNLMGKTSLVDFITLTQGAELVVSNDSGPMHLAAALQRPVVALFGPTPPELYGPYPLSSPRHRVLRAPNDDLAWLEAEKVADTVEALLDACRAD